ncbi:MAG: nucleotidyltransferase domain-containing protein [Candidatus Rokubacteria bacterium]|nr:nucleotidyltransferase domain-containing protein [Candidatus Rokubacteria bacterium]
MSIRSPADHAEVNLALRRAAERYAEALRGALRENLVSVVLFGSVARGEAGPDSDIDLLIVGEEFPPGRFARLRLLEDVDREFEGELVRLRAMRLRPRLARHLKTRKEAARVVPLYLDLVEDALLLYDREGFFQSVLARLEASLKRLGAERRILGQTRYWVLKPDLVPGEVFEL